MRCTSLAADEYLFSTQVDAWAATSVYCNLGCATKANLHYPTISDYSARHRCGLVKTEYDVKPSTTKKERDIDAFDIATATFDICCEGADGTDFTMEVSALSRLSLASIHAFGAYADDSGSSRVGGNIRRL